MEQQFIAHFFRAFVPSLIVLHDVDVAAWLHKRTVEKSWIVVCRLECTKSYVILVSNVRLFIAQKRHYNSMPVIGIVLFGNFGDTFILLICHFITAFTHTNFSD